MLARRSWLLGAAASGVASPLLTGCSSASVQEAARYLRRNMAIRPVGSMGDATEPMSQTMRELVRYATLAPSSHNTQCWQFLIKQSSLTIEPDLSRRCPAVDPDDHHLFVSLGCATENLVHTALAHGLRADAQFNTAGTGAIAVQLEATRAMETPLFKAMTQRQCTRADYDGVALTKQELRQLEQAGTGQGVRVIMLTEAAALEQVLSYVVAGNTAQMNDAAFLSELKRWIRFGSNEALRTGDGLFTAASGIPVLPRWLGSPLMDLVFTPKSENDRYAKQVRNSAGVAIFVSEANDRAHWIETGRCYERFALQATSMGIRNAFLNQPVEATAIRPQLASWLGVGKLRPDLVVRFGRGPLMPWSMRRPVDDVILGAKNS